MGGRQSVKLARREAEKRDTRAHVHALPRKRGQFGAGPVHVLERERERWWGRCCCCHNEILLSSLTQQTLLLFGLLIAKGFAVV